MGKSAAGMFLRHFSGRCQMRVFGKFNWGYGVLALVLCATLSACSPRVQTRGNLPDPELVAQLEEGGFSKDEVIEFLGSPSSVTAFGDEVWFYISERTETIAWLEPEIKDRQILALAFDDEGYLTEIKKVGLEEAKSMVPVGRVTPTHGNEMTVLEQVLGNFRRFTK